jgi:tol-pal system protein YbgF
MAIMKSILTTIAVTAVCGMMACAPARNAGSDLSLIQNQLDASNEKLEQLSQQVAMIQMLVDTHQRAIQDLKAPEDAEEDTRLPSVASGEAAPPAEPAPQPQPTRLKDTGTPPEPPGSETEPASSTAQVMAQETPSIPPEAESPPTSAGATIAVKEPNPFYQEAMEIFRSGDYELAAPLFEDFVEAFPENDLSDNALYWAGECKYTKKKFSEAILRFKRVVEEYPTGSKVPDALLKIGFAYISLGDMESAETYLKRVIAQYPFSSAGAKAEERLKKLQGQ